MSLQALLKEATRLELEFEQVLRKHYPRADKWVWYKACDRKNKGSADGWDCEMAGNEEIEAAHSAYISALHKFYHARDGDKGFLGSRGC